MLNWVIETTLLPSSGIMTSHVVCDGLKTLVVKDNFLTLCYEWAIMGIAGCCKCKHCSLYATVCNVNVTANNISYNSAILRHCCMWRHMRSRTIVPGRCRHCTMAAPMEQRQIYKHIFSSLTRSKRNQIAFLNRNCATSAPLYIF